MTIGYSRARIYKICLVRNNAGTKTFTQMTADVNFFRALLLRQRIYEMSKEKVEFR
jgi:hypothetical protein